MLITGILNITSLQAVDKQLNPTTGKAFIHYLLIAEQSAKLNTHTYKLYVSNIYTHIQANTDNFKH